MAPVKRRRRFPTLIDRGLGLLEVMLPHEGAENSLSPLPPGQRDDSGFWFPAGVERPGDIFTPQQRELQSKQRNIQRRRLRSDPPPAAPSRDGGEAATEPQASEICVPLPPPCSEAGGSRPGAPAPRGAPARASPPALPPDPSGLRGGRHRPAEAGSRLVDSGQGSE